MAYLSKMMSWDIALSGPWRTKGIVDIMNTRTLAVDTRTLRLLYTL